MTTLIALFTAAAGIQLVSWILISLGFRRAVAKPPPADRAGERVSIVVAARNAADTLPRLLQALREQSHTEFEAVIVDDHSDDDTADVVGAAASADERIRLVTAGGRGKKAAVTTGVHHARCDVIALTDADCIPHRDWLRLLLTHHHASEERVVVGYGPYRVRPGALNLLVRFETLHTALLTASAIGLGRPYMAVGRNLSYRRKTFDRLEGLQQAPKLLSGDDDLFVQAAAREGIPVAFAAEPGSFVESEPPLRFIDWVKQKRRHLSAGRRYNRITQYGLLAYHLSALLCWTAPLVLGWIGVGYLLCRLIPGQAVLTKAASTLQERKLAPRFVPLDLAFHLYLIAVAPLAWFRPPKRW